MSVCVRPPVLSKPHLLHMYRLTNEEARENFEKYGDVDGPRAAIIGIALPSFIVDKKNSLWVGVVSGRGHFSSSHTGAGSIHGSIHDRTATASGEWTCSRCSVLSSLLLHQQGTWWYRSVKYGVTNVLIDTSKLFMYLISRSKHTPVQSGCSIR